MHTSINIYIYIHIHIHSHTPCYEFQMLTFFFFNPGQTSPELLQVIHDNQEEFLTLMNEPIDETAATQPIPQAPPNPMLGR